MAGADGVEQPDEDTDSGSERCERVVERRLSVTEHSPLLLPASSADSVTRISAYISTNVSIKCTLVHFLH